MTKLKYLLSSSATALQKAWVILSLWAVITIAYGQDITTTQESSTITQNTIPNSTIVGTPQDWGLKQEEWSQYQKLMQGPNGHWYPYLTPPEVLGLNATTPQEQKHYAEIVAKEEHDKLARELAFNNAVHEALLRIYPNEQIIRPFNLSPYNPVQATKRNDQTALQAGDHIGLFVDPTQGLDFSTLPRLLATVKGNQGVTLDIYCVGKVDDNAIRGWAKLNAIPMDLVLQKQITLNHDKGKLQRTVGNVPLPYVILVRNGESRSLSLSLSLGSLL